MTLRHSDKSVGVAIAGVLESCPLRTFARNTELGSSKMQGVEEQQTACIYVLQDIAIVNIVARMAAGNVVLHTVPSGTIFAPDSTFFGLPEDTKIAWLCDQNADVKVKVISSEALSGGEISISILRWLAQEQQKEMSGYIATW